LEDGNELKRDEVCDVQTDEDPACQSDILAREDFEIEEENRDLRDG
jgi:hypothetical protein